MTTLYKKVGKRYKPVAEHEEWDSYPEGAHLVATDGKPRASGMWRVSEMATHPSTDSE